MATYPHEVLFDVFIKWLNLFNITPNPIENLFEISDGVIIFKLLSKLSPTYFNINSINQSPQNTKKSMNNNIIKLKKRLDIFFIEIMKENIFIDKMIDHNKITTGSYLIDDNIRIKHYVRLLELILICAFTSENKQYSIAKMSSLSLTDQDTLMEILRTNKNTTTHKTISKHLRKCNENKHTTIEHTTSTHSSLQTEIIKLNQQNTNQIRPIVALQNENKTLKIKNIQLKTGNIIHERAFKQCTDEYNKIKAQLEQEIDTYKENEMKHKLEIDRLISVNKRCYDKSLNDLKNQIQSLKQHNKNDKKQTVSELKQKNNEIQDLKQTVSELTRKNNECEKKYNDLMEQSNYPIEGYQPKLNNYECELLQTAYNIVTKSLQIPLEFLDASNNKCFCNKCHSNRGDAKYYWRGNPKKKYALPIGWVRVGLKVNEGKCMINNVWKDWHVAFHGCSKQSVWEIFRSGLHLLKAGDQSIDGNRLGVKSGHIGNSFERYNRYIQQMEYFDPKQIFVSPSIRYTSHNVYSPSFYVKEFKGNVKCSFQLRIRPGSYGIGQETLNMNGHKRIDYNFNNDELEWYTKENVGIVVHGLLIKLYGETQ
eukprot:486207_1